MKLTTTIYEGQKIANVSADLSRKKVIAFLAGIRENANDFAFDNYSDGYETVEENVWLEDIFASELLTTYLESITDEMFESVMKNAMIIREARKNRGV